MWKGETCNLANRLQDYLHNCRDMSHKATCTETCRLKTRRKQFYSCHLRTRCLWLEHISTSLFLWTHSPSCMAFQLHNEILFEYSPVFRHIPLHRWDLKPALKPSVQRPLLPRGADYRPSQRPEQPSCSYLCLPGAKPQCRSWYHIAHTAVAALFPRITESQDHRIKAQYKETV